MFFTVRHPVRHLGLWWVLLTLAALGGCVTTSSDGQVRPRALSPTNANGQDLPTQSDDSDVRRRAKIRLELASAYFAQGQLTTALDEVKQVLNLDPTLSEAFELRGLVYDGLREPAKADESFRKAIELDARNGSALHNHAWSLCRRGLYEQADALFLRAIVLPQSVGASKTLLAQGVCQMNAGKLADAERTLARSYEIDPANPATAYNRALVLFRSGDFDRARFYIRRLNAIAEQQTAASLWLAIKVEHKLGGRNAQEELSRSLRTRFPSSPEANLMELSRFDD